MPSCMAPSGGIGLHVTSMPKLFFNVFCHCLVFTNNYSFSSFFVSTEEKFFFVSTEEKTEEKLCFTIIVVSLCFDHQVLFFYSFHFLVVSMMIMHIPVRESLCILVLFCPI